MIVRDSCQELGVKKFTSKFPWIGGDLQTLRDTFVSDSLPSFNSQIHEIPVPAMPCGRGGDGNLIALLDMPFDTSKVKALVLMLHGLGGSSSRSGLQRMAFSLLQAGFAVLRLNLRGADPCRNLIAGTYSAQCNSDVEPAIVKAKELCRLLTNSEGSAIKAIPLFGVGISLGGTILLNACLNHQKNSYEINPLLDGLVCVSSPLDLNECSLSIERTRNIVYQDWLLKRLVIQTFSDPFGVNEKEREFLLRQIKSNILGKKSLRDFDSVITAPRWGFKDVYDYYHSASPINALIKNTVGLPKTLIIQSLDDPWVPIRAAKILAREISSCKNISALEFLFTTIGGHNGFHGYEGCWGDQLVTNWLDKLLI